MNKKREQNQIKKFVLFLTGLMIICVLFVIAAACPPYPPCPPCYSGCDCRHYTPNCGSSSCCTGGETCCGNGSCCGDGICCNGVCCNGSYYCCNGACCPTGKICCDGNCILPCNAADCESCSGGRCASDCDPDECESCVDGSCKVCGGDPNKECCGGQCIAKCDPNHPCDGQGSCVYINLTTPGEGENQSFDSSNPGGLTITCSGSIASGSVSGGDITFECDGIGDSAMSIGPVTIDGSGNFVCTITFTGLPTNNSAFGCKTVRMYYKGIPIGKRKVEIRFPKYGKNHPDPGSGITPNWYYYWKQTSAYYGSCQYDEPNDPNLQGGYTDWDAPNYTSYVCQDTPIPYKPGSPSDNNEVQLDGIDTFAWTCRHEWRHHISMLAWWGAGGHVAAQDIDYDGIPDSIESGFAAADGGPFDPNEKDTYKQDWPENDNERYTVVTQDHWGIGSAKYEDWACPGQQCP